MAVTAPPYGHGMDLLLVLIGLVIGTLPGLWLASRARLAARHERDARTEREAQASATETELKIRLAQAEAAQATDARMLDAFRSVSSEALASQSEQLLQLAEAKYGALQSNTDTVLGNHARAVDSGLRNLEQRLAALEKERSASTVELKALVTQLNDATIRTSQEAAKLASALKDTRVRGTWGEVQLRRALELAGLTRHIDFTEQVGVTGRDTAGRPDVVVPLPNGRCIIIDSKVPLDRYLESIDATDPDQQRALQVEHSRAVATHVKTLSSRGYTDLIEGSIDLVLMFLPGEPFLSAALDADPTLFESAADKGVYLVTPSSLVPLLRGVALGWRERQSEQAAAEIHRLGVELHERIGLFADHYSKVGALLDRTVEAFNRSVGSFDSRLVSTARRLSEHGAASNRQLPEVGEVESQPRRLVTVLAEPAVRTEPAVPAGTSVPAELQEVPDHLESVIGQD